MRPIIILLLLAIPLPTIAKDPKPCRGFAAKVERYENLRRQGGSGSQMDRWKKALKKNQELHRDCVRNPRKYR
jgi:hypothetical protein